MNPAKNNHRETAVRFPAEVWDQMQFFFQEYNDHHVHAVIYFQDLLDRECLKKAVCLTMEMLPILGSRFVINQYSPYWEKVNPLQDTQVISFVDCSNPEEEINRFITGLTNELTGPQLMVRAIRSSNQDTLCIVMNHMVSDGAGFKKYLYLLGRVYTEILNGATDLPDYPSGSRSAQQIYRQFKLGDRLKIFLLPNRLRKKSNRISFPFSQGNGRHQPFILTQRLFPDKFRLLKAYAKEHSATVNDLIMAAYYRTLSKLLDLKPNQSLTIPCAIDLRRYLSNRNTAGICNLTSMIVCNIGPYIGADFEETLTKVNQAMNVQKKNYPGLHGLSTLNILFKVLPFAMLRKFIKQNMVNPLIAITNIGVIDSEKLFFGKIPVADAFITGSIKYPPYFQLALTSFNDTITFSVNLYGSEEDREFIQKFLIMLDQELQSIPVIQEMY
jgi:NRPS condensation-like uncharacterized protein